MVTAKDYAPPAKRSDFYSRSSLFQCPSARLPRDVIDPAFQIALFSRAMNSQLISAPVLNRNASIQYGSIKYPERTVLFLDNRLDGEEKVAPGQLDSFLGQPSSFANRFAGRRHMRGGNLFFVDGHGSCFPGEQVVETRQENNGWAIVPPKDVVWEPDPD